LETKQAAIIKHDEAVEEQNNKELKIKIKAMKNIQLKNSGDVVKDV